MALPEPARIMNKNPLYRRVSFAAKFAVYLRNIINARFNYQLVKFLEQLMIARSKLLYP